MRETKYNKLDHMFLKRWSPRAFEKVDIPKEDLFTMFEAARWAPSCYNEQPWHFVYAVAEDEKKKFVEVLAEGNRVWAHRASALVVVFSRRHFDKNEKPNRWAEFDSGAAWMSMALQAHFMGYICHAMGGFDPIKAYETCSVNPDQYNAICVVAIGKMGDSSALPESLRERESPSDRRPLERMVSENYFQK